MLLKITALILALYSYFYLFSRISFASVKFSDDFNSYADGQFPSRWIPIHNPGEPACNALWNVEGGILKVKLPSHSPCAENITPLDSAWGQLIGNYTLEADVRFISGTDHNLSFRIAPDGINNNELHFVTPGAGFSIGVYPPISQNIYQSDKFYTFNEDYHIKVVIDNTNLKFYTNGDLTREVILENPLLLGKIALRIGTGNGSNTETWFDNVKVTTLDDENSNDLAVPLLKQTDPLWANDVYDSANLWSTGATDISRWGCAITSATMVLQYNKITKLPSGQDLTPGTLNSYLLTTPDGYMPNGLTNWHAISVMTKKAKVNNPNFAFDALKDDYKGANDSTTIENDLSNGMPDILQVSTGNGTHFVVAKGKNGTTFNINDPFFDKSDLSTYENTFASVKRFIPTNTDLSFLMFLVDPNTDIILKDEQGNIIGQSSLESPIGDPLNVLNNTVGPLKQVIFSEPPSGNYKVEVSSTNPASYFLHGYLYDIYGNVKMFEQKDILGQNDTDTYLIHFNKDTIADINIGQNVTLTTLKNDVVALYSFGHIKKEFYKELLEKIKEVEKNQNKKGESLYHKLKELSKEIGKKKGIDAYAAEILSHDIQALINSLPPASSNED